MLCYTSDSKTVQLKVTLNIGLNYMTSKLQYKNINSLIIIIEFIVRTLMDVNLLQVLA